MTRSLSRSLWLALPLLALMAAGCDNGPSCSPSCPSGVSLCCDNGSGAGLCRAILTDRANCGACGNACTGACTNGVCDGTVRVDAGPPPDAPPIDAPRDAGAGACVGGVRMCGGLSVSCTGFTGGANVDGRADPSFTNCAICGRMCDPVTASRCAIAGGGTNPSCLCGSDTCLSGEECLDVSGSFRCIDVQTDRENCGTVGNRCGGPESCVAGSCVCGTAAGATACGETDSCCNGGSGAACIPTEEDAMNCGGCGITCSAGQTCTGGACTCGGAICAPPGVGTLGEICCSDACVPQDNSNCGTCGTMCDPEDPDVTCIDASASPFGGGICCGMPVPFFGGICSDIFPTP